MRKTVAKRLRKMAVAYAKAKQIKAFLGWRENKGGKPGAPPSYKLFWAGWPRVYRDLKRAYVGKMLPTERKEFHARPIPH
jgi:hypothetical protein